MNNTRKVRVIAECIVAVQNGQLSSEECVHKYPQLEEELHAVFASLDSIASVQFSKEDKIELRIRKMNLMRNLPDRQHTVTKPPDFRYRLQNLKRRFAMTWVIIVSTIIALASGAGAVFASSDALPGDSLYPVKTWIEDVQLAIAPQNVDTRLHMQFTEIRVDEALELISQGRYEDLEEAAERYKNRTELLTQTMARFQVENPEEAVRLRLELEEKLQQQARLMKEYIEDSANSDILLRKQIRVMLETNTQLCLRIHENDVEPGNESENMQTEEVSSVEEIEIEEIEFEEEKGKIRKNSPSFEVIDGEGTMKFGLGGIGSTGVYAEINGSRYDCALTDDVAMCNMNDAPQNGTVNLYDAETHQLLFSYAYENKWNGEKNENNSISGKNENNGKEPNNSSKGK